MVPGASRCRCCTPQISNPTTSLHGPESGLEVVSLQNKYDHGAQRVALPLLHTSDLQSGHFSTNKLKTSSQTQAGQKFKGKHPIRTVKHH